MRRSWTSLAIGVVFAIIAVALMYNYISAATRGPVQAGPAVELGTVVVASKSLPFGAPVVKESLKTVKWPKGSIPQGAFTNVDEIYAGATAPGDRIALALINQDEPITHARVSGFGAKPTLSRQVESGKRAISIRVDDVVGVAGFVLPGDRVDVMLTRRIGTAANNLRTEIILQDITILGIDQSADQAADKPIVARTATVEVTPEQAQKVILAQQAGSLSLALRSVDTAGLIDTQPITENDLSTGRRPAPALAPALAPVVRIVPTAPPPPAAPTVRVRYGDGSAVDRVVRP
jgi:pilus assembly protein CpaB